MVLAITNTVYQWLDCILYNTVFFWLSNRSVLADHQWLFAKSRSGRSVQDVYGLNRAIKRSRFVELFCFFCIDYRSLFSHRFDLLNINLWVNTQSEISTFSRCSIKIHFQSLWLGILCYIAYSKCLKARKKSIFTTFT